VIGITDSGTFQQGRLQKTGERVEHPQVQLLLRSPDYPTGWDKGKQLERGLFDKIGVDPAMGGLGWVNTTLDAQLYTISAIHVMTPLFFLGIEKDNRRNTFSINVQMEFRQ
jgi:hypothetical protein